MLKENSKKTSYFLFEADILKEHHNCNTIILVHRKHALLGYTLYTYGTEGLGQQFIGTSSSDRSQEGNCDTS
jgi:hypothetical protein